MELNRLHDYLGSVFRPPSRQCIAKLKKGRAIWNPWKEALQRRIEEETGDEVNDDEYRPFRLGLSALNLSKTNLAGVDLNAAFLESTNFQDADLRNSILRDAILSFGNFSNANLCGSDLSETHLIGASLKCASASEANFEHASMEEADLENGNFSFSDMSSANLTGANLRSADLKGVNFDSACLNDADLSGANLVSATFKYTCLDRTLFASREIGHTVFAGVDLSRARGLQKVRHSEPSFISVDVLTASKSKLPMQFLLRAGVPKNILACFVDRAK